MGTWAILGIYLIVGVAWAQTARVVCAQKGDEFPWQAYYAIILLWFVIIPLGLRSFRNQRERELKQEHPAFKQRREVVEKEKQHD